MAEVRLFASLREAAGTARTDSGAATVAQLLAELRGRYGEEFDERLEAATVLVDGDATDHDADTPLDRDSEVVLLPPFSGG